MDRRSHRLKTIGDYYDTIRAEALNTLTLGTPYELNVLTSTLMQIMLKYCKKDDVLRYKVCMIDFELLNINYYNDKGSYYISKKNKFDINDLEVDVNDEAAQVSVDELRRDSTEVIVNLYLKVVNDWITKGGRVSTSEYIKVLDKLTGLYNIDLDDSKKTLDELYQDLMLDIKSDINNEKDE